MAWLNSATRHMPETNTARDAALYQLRVQAGDVVVLGTDGLFDNLFDHELVSLTRPLRGGGGVSGHLVQSTADDIAQCARSTAEDKSAATPWSGCVGGPERRERERVELPRAAAEGLS